MEAMTTKRNQLRAQQLIQALKQRNMEASYAATKEEALEQALAWIPEGSCIGWGGSVSIDAIGLKDAVRQGNYRVIDRDTAANAEEKEAMYRRILADCDYFLTSTNAISQDGVLVNIDGTANRLAAMCYGPRHVLYIVGMNKVVATRPRTPSTVPGTRPPPSTPCASASRPPAPRPAAATTASPRTRYVVRFCSLGSTMCLVG